MAALVGAVGGQEPRPPAGSPMAQASQDSIDYFLASTCQALLAQLPRAQSSGDLSGGDATDPRTQPLRQPGRPDVPGRGLSKGPWTD